MLKKLVIGVVLLVVGCTEKIYSGPELPKSKVAVLKHVSNTGKTTIPPKTAFVYKHQTVVLEIDGESAPIFASDFQILPGRHTLRVSYSRTDLGSCKYKETVFDIWSPEDPISILIRRPDCTVDYSDYFSIEFTAKAEHKYRVFVERTGATDWIWVDDIPKRRVIKNYIWVEDVTIGKVVAGEKTPPAEIKSKSSTSVVALPARAHDFQKGLAAYKRGDYATALSEFRPLAIAGNGSAQYYLADIHANGRGIPENNAEASFWYREAADQGHAQAQFQLGSLYERGGRGVPRDLDEAVEWYRKAAKQEHTEAKAKLVQLELQIRERALKRAQKKRDTSPLDLPP